MTTKLKKDLAFKKILGVAINSSPKERLLNFVETTLEEKQKIFIVTPNPEQLVLASVDSNFLQVLNKANLSIPDGVGMVWASKVLKKGIQERISGIDFMLDLCRLAGKKDWRVFLLGAESGVAQKAAQEIKKKFGPKIAFSSGTQDIKKETKEEREAVIKKINDFRPHLLFVAYGAPDQEEWLHQNLSKLDVGGAMVVGGSLDFIAKKIKRAPVVLQRLGLEWFWRLLQEPWRVKRQLKLLKFIFLVFQEKYQKD